MSNVVIFTSTLAVILYALNNTVIAAEKSEIVSVSTVQLQWTTEPMNAPSKEKLSEVQFGARDSVSIANGDPQNRRYTSLSITAFGKRVPVQAWMYMDLANPNDRPYVVYGNKNGITINFRVGEGGDAWDVAFRLMPQSSGYKVTERQVCLAEMKPDACVVTYNSVWQPE
jgi:hypothetical protein